MRRCLLSVVLAVLAGCSTSDSIENDSLFQNDDHFDVAVGEVAEELVLPDVAVLADEVSESDYAVGETVYELPDLFEGPGPGEAGYDCLSNDQCDSGFCIETPAGLVCTETCQEECPFDWKCVQHAGSGTDPVFICAPRFLDVCRPCQTNADCRANGVSSGQVCLDLGAGGAFCGEACETVGDCPAGYDCQQAVSTVGEEVVQCVLQDGECPCSQMHIDQEALTDCWVENQWGICPGFRWCEGSGLTNCDAVVPAQEECNLEDDDCDGAVDEDTGGGPCFVTSEYGVCPGELVCAGGQEQCAGDEASAETCDGNDNDCDGQVDEGFQDTDEDGVADCLETDIDGDGIADGPDNCPQTFNPGQEDFDFDNDGDLCDADDDNDLSPDTLDCVPKDPEAYPGAEEVCDGKDNDCNLLVDEGFADLDDDGWKDCVDDDDDGDESPDLLDCQPLDHEVHPGAEEFCDGKDNNCDVVVDEGHADLDGDGSADCVDGDIDGDGVDNETDNCPTLVNEDQADGDDDGLGDACDKDADGDGIPDGLDNCPGLFNPVQGDVDGDGQGNACDPDLDGDDVENEADNCPLVHNPGQTDTDQDGLGDACEGDKDGDGAPDGEDCAQLNPAVYPGASEICDGVDNNCSGVADEGYPDFDKDGLKDCLDSDDDDDGDPDETDCAPADAAVSHGALEACDGVDNNCSGEIDEGFGQHKCGKGVCAHSIELCVEGKVQYCDPYEGAHPEVCDGMDNDCDGLMDEDQGTSTCGLGACFHTVANCVNGQVQACDVHEGAEEEACDGLDNDCDGPVDEGLGQLACGLGQCFHTTPACMGGEVQQCDPLKGSVPEVCDGADNDCDGETDEQLGSTTCGMGFCEHTVDNCLGGAQQVCNPLEGAALEQCDGLDNNCNGLLDDGLGIVFCGKGACLHSVVACVEGEQQLCDPFEGAAEEVCDGQDNDCDGQVDEDLGATVCGLGNCQHEQLACVAGVGQVCDPLEGAVEEECDGQDNNCDGQVDEGFADSDDDGLPDCLDEDDDDDGVVDTDDCAPLNSAVFPGAEELCFNDVDDDCDGQTPDACVMGSCKALNLAKPGLLDGSYSVDPDGAEGLIQPFEVYCDMTTDGGGWTLVSTQKPDGQLYVTPAVSSVVLDKGINQKYSNIVLASFASQGEYHVMVEENSGADANAGLVMVYKMPSGVGLRFDSKRVEVDSVEWFIGDGYFTVTNNEAGSGGWWGLSVHGSGFNGLASNKRCVKKADFSQSGGSNGDYKLDHQSAHSGTTRCVHGTTGIGVAHWIR